MKIGPRWKFVRGLREQYDPKGNHLDAIYFATDTREILMNGVCFGSAGEGVVTDINISEDNILRVIFEGDKEDFVFDLNKLLLYASAMPDNTQVPKNIGGIKAGTTAEDLKKKSISEILDNVIFPEVQPTMTIPKASISFIGNFKNGDIFEVGEAAPTKPDNFITSFYRGVSKVIGQTDRYLIGEMIEGDIYCNNNINLPEEVILGEMKYVYSVSYGEGDELVTSKGNPISSETENPISAGNMDSNEISIFGTYPFYSNGVPCSEVNQELYFPTSMEENILEKLPLMKWDTKVFAVAFASEAATGSRIKMQFPAEKKIEKVEVMNPLSGTWIELRESEWIVETLETVEGDKQYKLFTTTPETPLKGALQVRFTIDNV